jgi:predicted AlkP superfamily phosphohydrolase/phosphomutase
MRQLDSFDEGILASVFDSLDRVQHMFWRDRPDIVDEWYGKLDGMIGRVSQRLEASGKEKLKLVILSDHGFCGFDFKVHLNHWLLKNGYLVTGNGESESLGDVDWSRTRAYAVGLNSLYINLVGREGQGVVRPDQAPQLIEKLRTELVAWQGPDGRPVVKVTWRQDEAFEGPLATRGPDIAVGFTPGYRASAETGMGKWGECNVEPNRDHWGADHCVEADAVPGVLFCNLDLENYPHPSYRDIPALTIGMTPTPSDGGAPPPPSMSEEDQEVVEERLRSLGYL